MESTENIVKDADNTALKNEEAYNIAVEELHSYQLEWTFRSVNYVLNKENVSFGQLRSCVYVIDERAAFDYIRSTLTLIKAGLVGSKQIHENEYKKLEDRAFEILEQWRERIGFIGTLHLLIIKEMETKHFFMGTPDLEVIGHLNSLGLQKDLVTNILKEDMEERVRQSQAMKGI